MNGFSSYVSGFFQQYMSSYGSGISLLKPWEAGALIVKLSALVCDTDGTDWVTLTGNAYEDQRIVNGQFTTEIYPDPELGTVGWWLSGDAISFPRAAPHGWGVILQLGFWSEPGEPGWEKLVAGAELVGPLNIVFGDTLVFLPGTTRTNTSIALKITTEQ